MQPPNQLSLRILRLSLMGVLLVLTAYPMWMLHRGLQPFVNEPISRSTQASGSPFPFLTETNPLQNMITLETHCTSSQDVYVSPVRIAWHVSHSPCPVCLEASIEPTPSMESLPHLIGTPGRF